MAQEFDNKNTWVLFKNDKGDNEKRPDYTGTEVDANGVEHRIADGFVSPDWYEVISALALKRCTQPLLSSNIAD